MMTLSALPLSSIYRPLRVAIATLAIMVAGSAGVSADSKTAPASNRYERNYIVDGNKLYRQSRFAEAETMYKKALEQNPTSAEARFNLAASYIRQSGSADPNADRNPMGEARNILSDLAQLRSDMTDAERNIARLANYNLGNIAFNNNDFSAAIENYKRALRIDPDDDRARQNLRLAQLKLKEQQQQDQNKDQNQNQDNDQQQDQNKDQNRDQNQDQDKSQDQNKDNKDQNQDQPQGQDDKKKDKPQNQRSGISDANAEQILKAMENEEAATRKRVEAERRKAEAAKRRRVTNPW